MKANEKFIDKTDEFWAYIRLISDNKGRYKKTNENKGVDYTIEDLTKAVEAVAIEGEPLFGDIHQELTPFGEEILSYLQFRSEKLAEVVDLLQDRDEAHSTFERYSDYLNADQLQANKQGGSKPLVFENTVNGVIQKEYGSNYTRDPQKQHTFTNSDDELIKTTSKRLDGAVPSTHDPYAIWEVKEYYDSTTYGSGVTEGTYAAMLVADEIRAIEEEIENTIEIYILVDGYAGWQNGFGDLCRIIDFLHMGYIDAAIFGKEVETEWPKIVSKWD